MITVDATLALARTQLVQLTATILLAALLARAWRRRPHVAHAIWLVVVVKALTPPVWSSPAGVFSWAAVAAAGATAPGSSQGIGKTGSGGAPPPGRRTDGAPSGQAEVARTRTAGLTSPPRPFARSGRAGGDICGPGRPGPEDRGDAPRPEAPAPYSAVKRLALVVWAAGVVAALGVPLARLTRLRRLVRARAVAASGPLMGQVDRVRDLLGLSRPVRVVVCDEPIGPAVIGALWPTVVLPRFLEAAVESRALEGALAHELAHVWRRDPLVALLQWMATAAWWFHPGIWWANRQLNAAREASCDEEAVGALGCPPAEYAQMLVDVARRCRAAAAACALGVSPVQVTTRRLEHLMNPLTRFHRRTPAIAHMLCLTLALVLLPGARLAPKAAAVEAPTAPAEMKAITFSGTVVDAENGRPVEGGSVVVHRIAAGVTRERVAPDTELRADASGRFEFEVPPEQQANKHLYLELDVRHPKYASKTGQGYGLSLIQRDLALGNKPWFDRIALSRGEEIRGRLIDPDGKPAANVPVQFTSVGGPYSERFITDQRVDDTANTDADGRFRFNAIAVAGMTCFQARPTDHAILFHDVRDERGDLGTFRLEPGVSVSGTVVGFDGNPVPGVGVELASVEQNVVQNPVAFRRVRADAQGRFLLPPVRPGAYDLSVSDVAVDEKTGDTRTVPVRDAFEKRQVVVEYGAGRVMPVEVKGVEHVTVSLQYVDSAGKPRGGHPFLLVGKLRDKYVLQTVRPEPSGLATAYVPKGLTDAHIELSTDSYSALRWRRGATGELEPHPSSGRAASHIELGTLDADVKDLFVVRYDAPILVVRAVDADGKSIPKYKPVLRYLKPEPVQADGAGAPTRNGTDVDVERQDDGSWRTEQLQPDVTLTVSVTADGYRATPQSLTLKEKEVREVTVHIAKE